MIENFFINTVKKLIKSRTNNQLEIEYIFPIQTDILIKIYAMKSQFYFTLRTPFTLGRNKLIKLFVCENKSVFPI